MVTENGHRSIARIAIENCKFKRVNEFGIALRVVTQFAQFAFRHRDYVVENLYAARRVANRKRLATRRSAKNTYLGEAAPAGAGGGAAMAGEAAPIGAIGGSFPVLAWIDDLVSALAAAFACRLHR